MNEKHITNISKQLNLGEDNVTNTIDLLRRRSNYPIYQPLSKGNDGEFGRSCNIGH